MIRIKASDRLLREGSICSGIACSHLNLSDVLEMKAGDDVEDIFSIVVVRFFQKRQVLLWTVSSGKWRQ